MNRKIGAPGKGLANQLAFPPLLAFLILVSFSACIPQNPGEIAADTPFPVETSEAHPTASPTKDPAPLSGGPFLLLQSGVDSYSIINFADLSIIPFDPPEPNRQYTLGANLSPSQTQMLFAVSQEEVQVYSFITGKVHTTYHLISDPPLFQIDQAVEAARAALPGLQYSEEALTTAVKNALIQSKGKIQWFQSDRYRLSVMESGPTSTQLTLDDQQTGSREPLEDSPALVEAYWIGPSGELILLKKGTIFDGSAWRDDRYYIVDSHARTAVPIELPENAVNPRVFWFTSGLVGIIHQPSPAGGVDFSLFSVSTQTMQRIVTGPFDAIRRLGDGLLTFTQDRENEKTTLTLQNLTGQVIHTQEEAGLCFFSVGLSGDRLLMNCGPESILVEGQQERLSVEPFGAAVFQLATSPNGNLTIHLSQDSAARLLDSSFSLISLLTLESDPLEIRWLPDSSGFIYRTSNGLYLYQIAEQASTFLLASDLFSDYRNLNAAWIRFEE